MNVCLTILLINDLTVLFVSADLTMLSDYAGDDWRTPGGLPAGLGAAAADDDGGRENRPDSTGPAAGWLHASRPC